jgi:hypothetical protein
MAVALREGPDGLRWVSLCVLKVLLMACRQWVSVNATMKFAWEGAPGAQMVKPGNRK